VGSDALVYDICTDSAEVCCAAAVGDCRKIGRDDSGRGTYAGGGGRKTNVVRMVIVRNVNRTTTTRKCIIMGGSRLPSPSVGGHSWKLTRAPGGDTSVVAALHSEGCGIILVPFGFVKARNGSVVAVRAETMGPAVEHLAALHGDMPSCSRGCSSWGCSRGDGSSASRTSAGCRSAESIVGAVKPSIASGEAPNAFFVAEDEFRLEESNSPFDDRAETKLFGGSGEAAGLFDHSQHLRGEILTLQKNLN
jgi:hypothetical protein